jgi:hypothetical protein
MKNQERGSDFVDRKNLEKEPWREWHDIGTVSNNSVVAFIRDLTGAQAVNTARWKEWTERNENVVPIAVKGIAKWEYSKDARIGHCFLDERTTNPEDIYVVDIDLLYTMTYTSSTGSKVRLTREEKEGFWKVEVKDISAKWPHRRTTLGRLRRHMKLVVPQQFVEPSDE